MQSLKKINNANIGSLLFLNCESTSEDEVHLIVLHLILQKLYLQTM